MDGYETVVQTAERWGVTTRRVQKLCEDGVLPGVNKFGTVWAIPADLEKPADRRVKSGNYRNWRKKKEEKSGP